MRNQGSLKDKLVYAMARLVKKMQMSAIRNSSVPPTSKVESGSQIVDTNFGRHSFCGYNCTILNADIGSFCSIADAVYIGGSAHPMHFVSTSPVFLSHRDSVRAKFASHDFCHMPRTSIGNDVWIGHGAKIKAGVSVGNGAVIGMGSVVTKDVRPYEIVAGVPARFIGFRFEPEIAQALLETKWWDYDDMQLLNVGRHFDSPEQFLATKRDA